VPLENPQANKYEWVEDIGRILLDMMGTYYGERPVVRTKDIQIQTQVPVTNPNNGQPVADPMTGAPMMKNEIQTQQQKTVDMFDFSQLKNLWLNVRADVGASTYWSRIAVVQTLDNLKKEGLLDIIDYLERMPDEYIPLKDELIDKYKKLQLQQGAMPMQQEASGGSPGVGGGPSQATLLGSMPVNTQMGFDAMPKQSQKAILQQAQLQQIGGIV
jgi:hypothetical protein